VFGGRKGALLRGADTEGDEGGEDHAEVAAARFREGQAASLQRQVDRRSKRSHGEKYNGRNEKGHRHRREARGGIEGD